MIMRCSPAGMMRFELSSLLLGTLIFVESMPCSKIRSMKTYEFRFAASYCCIKKIFRDVSNKL